MSHRLLVLGSGTSFGIPVIGCDCRVCTSVDPRDRRTRVAAVVESENQARVLIDTPPELRLQLVRAKIDRVDAVLYTHDHADHLHGIDDLRAMSVRRGALPLYGPAETIDAVVRRFGYIFDEARPPEGTSKPNLTTMALDPAREVTIAGITVLPIDLDHGGVRVFGYRMGPLAYLTDVKVVSERAFALLDGVKILVINALFDRPHPTHLSISEALEVGRRLAVERIILTHLSHKFSHAELAARLPGNAEPAYDGLTLVF